MQYKKTSSIQGKWCKGSEITSGTKAKLVSETIPQPSQFLNKDGSPKTQDVAKIRFEGGQEPLNISLNRATINGLIGAFGEDSKAWIGQVLTAVTEKVRVAGKAQTALYLVPEGYVKIDDENGYAVIAKEGAQVETQPDPFDQALDEPEPVNMKDIPF